MHNTAWCEVGLKFSDIGTNNVVEYEFNPRSGYDMVILENLHNTFTIGVI